MTGFQDAVGAKRGAFRPGDTLTTMSVSVSPVAEEHADGSERLRATPNGQRLLVRLVRPGEPAGPYLLDTWKADHPAVEFYLQDSAGLEVGENGRLGRYVRVVAAATFLTFAHERFFHLRDGLDGTVAVYLDRIASGHVAAWLGDVAPEVHPQPRLA